MCAIFECEVEDCIFRNEENKCIREFVTLASDKTCDDYKRRKEG